MRGPQYRIPAIIDTMTWGRWWAGRGVRNALKNSAVNVTGDALVGIGASSVCGRGGVRTEGIYFITGYYRRYRT